MTTEWSKKIQEARDENDYIQTSVILEWLAAERRKALEEARGLAAKRMRDPGYYSVTVLRLIDDIEDLIRKC